MLLQNSPPSAASAAAATIFLVKQLGIYASKNCVDSNSLNSTFNKLDIIIPIFNMTETF